MSDTTPIRDELPRDPKGRLSGAYAIEQLMGEIPDGGTWPDGSFMNTWDAADQAIESMAAGAGGEEIMRAALRRLFALHLFGLEEDTPTVAMSNLRVGDVVLLFGVRRTITEILPGFVRADGRKELYATTSGGRLPLIARPLPDAE